MSALACLAFVTTGASADPLRIATYNTELGRDGPGLLLRDILRGDDPQITATLAILTTAAADIVALQGFDYDLTGAALGAYQTALRDRGLDYPYSFAIRPNSGWQSGLDLDGDGRLGGPGDAQGYGRFSGQNGMAILSRFPIAAKDVQDFSPLLWRDLPGALLPETDEGPYPSATALAAQRLSSKGHWIVPVDVPGLGRVHLMTFHASPPVFDGLEDRNGKRNHDETAFWLAYLDGAFGIVPRDRFILLGDANSDPVDGDSRKSAIVGLLGDPRLQDPAPVSAGGRDATGDAGDTVDWDDPQPGNLRVDYALPSTDWTVLQSGVIWPPTDDPLAAVAESASRHRLVWVDLDRP
ncbi:endonuclease/exonuclease/phosphatase family protein [Sulfitobacter sabulilitoris]|uniref:endonuclease/exonuclease/phosphatase family protein n=1 Tax=Sulfitobacter sabulilitoris TaxID=2562655 RepID=UPI0014793738|nr:endonuclease/exonuclease/phosphatase family protein [Sulfitobacter sabulilitoris]